MQRNDMVWRRNGDGMATTRGRETMQQPTKQTNKWTNEQTKRAEREATMWQEVKMWRKGMEAADSLPRHSSPLKHRRCGCLLCSFWPDDSHGNEMGQEGVK